MGRQKRSHGWEGRMTLLVAVGLLLAYQLFSMFWIYQALQLVPEQPTAYASSGVVRFCINTAPVPIIACSNESYINNVFLCQMNFTDDSGTVGSWTSRFISGSELFTIGTGGLVNYTPTNSDIGNYSVELTVEDNTGCDFNNGTAVYNFSVLSANNPPRLLEDIPDVTFAQDQEIRPYFLSTYFMDPNEDQLFYLETFPSNITLNISDSSQVKMTSSHCGAFTGTFTAVEYNTTESYTNTSNIITVTVTCPASSSGGAGTESGASSGGSGGTSSLCKPDWNCQQWTPCLRNNTRYKVCYDYNGCDPDHYQQQIYEGCTFQSTVLCPEAWQCGEWSACSKGERARTCLDLNDCGTTSLKPNETESCPLPTSCLDDIQNGDETGIDCGGSLCGSCQSEEQPAFIQDTASKVLFLIALILLLGLLAVFAMRHYRGEIAEWLAKMGWVAGERHVRTVLLGRTDLEKLLMQLSRAQKKWPLLPDEKASTEYTVMARSYIKEALKVPYEAAVDEITRKMRQIGIHRTPKKLIESMMHIVVEIEKGSRKVTREELQYLFWELRTCMLITSEVGRGEYHPEQEPSDVVPDSEKTKAYETLREINSSIRHLQLPKAKNLYLQLLEHYNSMQVHEKESIYPHLIKTYCLIEMAETI